MIHKFYTIFMSEYIISNYLAISDNSKDTIHTQLATKISKSKFSNGGFSTTEILIDKINTFVEPILNNNAFTIKRAKEIEYQIDNLLSRLSSTISKETDLNVYLLPTGSDFIMNYMDSIAGWCPSKNTIHLYIHPDCSDIHISETLAHEYNHTIFRENNNWNRVIDGIIAEGLAEHFREDIVGGMRSKWTTVFEESETLKRLSEIERLLPSTSPRDYNDVFTNFDNDPYQLWTGYSLGYYIVKSYLPTSPSWNKIMNEKPGVILEHFIQSQS